MKMSVVPEKGSRPEALEQAERGGAHRHDAPAPGARRLEALAGGGGDLAPLGMHLVVARVLGLDRQEGAGAHMQRDEFL